tara:strand:+ start:1464 stop:1727 length:264 start_codon:yes stop_codon:yes gene_type:complete
MSENQSAIASDIPTDFLKADQVVARIGVSVKTNRTWVQNGDCAHQCSGRRVRISMAGLWSCTEAMSYAFIQLYRLTWHLAKYECSTS